MCHELTAAGSECFEIQCSSMINKLTITYGNSVANVVWNYNTPTDTMYYLWRYWFYNITYDEKYLRRIAHWVGIIIFLTNTTSITDKIWDTKILFITTINRIARTIIVDITIRLFHQKHYAGTYILMSFALVKHR